MKKLVKVILPPFIGFAIYFVAIRYNALYFTLRTDQMGQGNLASYMAFFKYLMPLLFVVAVLTQLLIINPVAYYVSHKNRTVKIWAILVLILVCMLFAAGISYAIWDENGTLWHLTKTFGFMTVIQLIYWLINLFTLGLWDEPKKAESK
jgi:hypothetical protein